MAKGIITTLSLIILINLSVIAQEVNTNANQQKNCSFGDIQISSIDCDALNMCIDVEIIGGEAPLTYLWSTGSDQEDICGLSPGDYQISVTDGNTCNITTSVNIEAPETPTISLPNSINACPFETITLDAGLGFDSYLWSTGEVTQSITVFDADAYSVTVVDDNSCTATASSVVTKLPNVNLIYDDYAYICEGDEMSFSLGGFSEYLWSDGTTEQTMTTGSAGVHWVSAFSGVCYYYDTIHIIHYPSPTLDIGNDVYLCSGDTLELVATGGFANYVWQDYSIGQSFLISESGTITLQVNDINGCSAVDSIHAFVTEPPYIQTCYVEFDSISLKNRINWMQQSNIVSEINIYKEVSIDAYNLIGTTTNSETSFIDINSNPQETSSKYKISIVDTCENEGILSDYHQTIYLQNTYDSNTSTNTFSWSEYIGLTFSNYLLFGITDSNEIVEIASIPSMSNSFDYINSTHQYSQYYIGFETEECNSESMHLVQSNIITSTSLVTESEIGKFSIHPNPSDKIIYVETEFENYSIEIINIFGQKVLENINHKEIDISNLPYGTYTLRIISKGKTKETKLMVI